MEQGHGRNDLEIGGPGLRGDEREPLTIHGLDRRNKSIKKLDEFGGRTGLPVDGNAFLNAL